jgi:enoyl-CoA hydratase/carnithine racemase
MSEPIHVDHPADGVTLVTLDRPSRLNAFDAELFAALPLVLESLIGDASTRAVVITGAGDAFCAGADLERHGLRATDEAGIEAWMRQVHRGALALHRLPQVTVAAINGAAAGGGLALALGCDLRIAAPTAVLSTAFAARGLGPDFGMSQLLPRAVGLQTAVELLLTGRRLDGAEALRLGLVTRVAEDPLAAAIELATIASALPRELSTGIKETVRRAQTLDLVTVLEELEPRAQAAHIARRVAGGGPPLAPLPR